jgi:hypothetical protein
MAKKSVDLVRFRVELGTNNLVRIDGNNDWTDWQVEGRTVGGYIELGPRFLTNAAKARRERIPAKAELYIPVRSLKSVAGGKPFSGLMDDIMYQKLREGTNERIKYNLTEIALKEAAEGDAPWTFETKGNLTVAGVNREITMPVEMAVKNGALSFSARIKIKMSDFSIDLPVMETVQGPVKLAHDEVTLTIAGTAVATGSP